MSQESNLTITINPQGEVIRTLPIMMRVDRQTGKLFARDENSGREYSISELEQMANSGDLAAQCAMGDYYNNEQNQDLRKAFVWYEKAAKQNYARAQWNMGNIYGVGIVVEKDLGKALSWFEKAAIEGYLEAMLNLGRVFLMNDNYEKGIYWLEEADKFGHPEAKQDLEMAVKLRKLLGR